MEDKVIGCSLTVAQAITLFRKHYTVATVANGEILRLNPSCFNVTIAKFLLLDKREGLHWWAE